MEVATCASLFISCLETDQNEVKNAALAALNRRLCAFDIERTPEMGNTEILWIIVGIQLLLVAGIIIFWKLLPALLQRITSSALWQRIRRPWWPQRRQPGATTPAAQATEPPLPPTDTFPDRSVGHNAISQWLLGQIDGYQAIVDWKEEHHAEKTPRVKEELYRATCYFVLLLAAGLTIVIFTFVPSVAFAQWGFPLNPQWFLLLPIIAYLLLSFRQVDTDQVAGADLFGKPAKQFESGLAWVPLFIFGFNKEPTTFVQAELPGDSDHIQWGDEKDPLKDGKVRPLYVLSGEHFATDAQGNVVRLPTDFQMNFGVSFFTQFRLVKERFFELEVNIGDIDPLNEGDLRRAVTGGTDLTKKMLEVVRQIRDTGAAVLVEVLGQMSLNEIRQHMTLINRLLRLRLQAKVMDWGIDLVDGRITKTNPGHSFNEELQNRGKAVSKRDSMITVAEGTRRKLALEGEGAAAAELALLNAKAEGYEAIGRTTGTEAGSAAMASETVQKLAEAGNVVVVGTQGVADLMGLVKAAQKPTGGNT